MWIGDFVRCHSVVKLLRQRYPNRPIDVLTTTLCAPLLDYMPGVRKGIVCQPAAQAAGAGRASCARADGSPRERYGSALVMPRTWKSALAPFLAGIPERTGFAGRDALRAAQRHAFRRTAAAAHDRPLRRAGAARGARNCRPTGRCPNWPCRSPRPSTGGRSAACPTTAGRWWRSPPARSARASAGRSPISPSLRRFADRARGRRSGCWAARTRHRSRPRSCARPGPMPAISPRPTCATPSWRCGSQPWRSRTIPAWSTSPPRSARRPSAFSGRPARGTGRRSTRSPPPSRPRPTCPAGPATSRPAGFAHHRCMRDIPPSQVLAAVRRALGSHLPARA